MGNTFRLLAGGVDAVESEFGDGGTPALCRPPAGRGSHDGRVPGVRHLPPKGEKCYPCVRYEVSPMARVSHASTRAESIEMVARIYKPAKTAMQSGTANAKSWVLDYEPEAPREVEPLMGWTSSGDMKQQLRLRFHSKAEAIAYCE